MKRYVYVGSYTEAILFGTGKVFQAKGKGIYRFLQDTDTGLLELDTVWEGIENPSFLTLNRQGDRLYAVNELKTYEGAFGGSVSAFAVEGKELIPLGRIGTGGADPCHVALLEDQRSLYVANFMSGSVSGFGLDENGGLACLKQFIQHEGSSVDPQRQQGPHAHSVVLHKGYAYVPDLGLDSVLCYQIDPEGLLVERADQRYNGVPGAGPRHCVFAPNGLCYVINELNNTVSIAHYDGGRTDPSLSSYSTLPKGGFAGETFCAGISLNRRGDVLYASNRGHNSIVVFSIKEDALKLVECCDCRGEIPRHFAITPDDRYLICANQNSDTLTVFSIEQGKGTLTFVQEMEVPSPVCVFAEERVW